MNIQKIAHDIFTGKDNQTYTPERVYGGLLVFPIMTYAFIVHPTFTELCTGLSLYLGAWCAGIKIKDSSEP